MIRPTRPPRARMPLAGLLLAGLTALSALAPAAAADLYREESFQALTSDRRAQRVGDLITILVYENSSARNTADTTTKTNVGIGGNIKTLGDTSSDFTVGLGDNYGGRGQIQRSGNLLAQISATVTGTYPNGDLAVSGEQRINVNGEKTQIRLSGKIRPVDIAQNNTILSSRIADARIDYTGDGYITDRTRPGLIPKILAWLGLW
ncbi:MULTISPECIES: flagellar basal body L-ring protein FlgH [unclassified Lysobacter]|uniref:flagellar basal body L-ring protein FlgH n=1 Tax=unclassified Lysobacter TaxID=2635362 RepID=UPI001BE630F8|nr:MULTISPECIES: flagellar basal body L-ring protein FlgH [unclassified Lysobacter]MBT2745978.1 flagellar basal body L-ring protein FlgH [Lysobacter sp. ISL-42]MBT2752638.1 flagellar basal body L-ring protein FlgH [Lysobacter sp. ISL-50]MBT2777377.1 flagellar basal body L-ring protein FlgH [Lysobacter sp. ISL-54]MBT2783568.1 flagellar basal body L-ring protein FlgH [Lysobacter sp. ISL-52]